MTLRPDPRTAQPRAKRPLGALNRRFGVPPFTILDARQGYWKERKASWIASGVAGPQLGRGAELTFSQTAQSAHHYAHKSELEAKLGQSLSWPEFWLARPDLRPMTQTSEFDPVLAEMAMIWFVPPGGLVLDPFAGGPVRGLVAHKLGRRYVGVELRPEQIEANRLAAEALDAGDPQWILGDSRDVQTLAPGEYDALLTCPPYADLERYSDDPRDLSTMPYDRFLTAYREIVAASCSLLRDDRFATVVVGDVRDRKGLYRGFVRDTICAFEAAGLRLYNEAIYIPPYGSLPARAGRTFAATRKLGKAHQNLLVFVKGNPRQAAKAVGSVVVDALEAGQFGV